jgi:hypothetical protein
VKDPLASILLVGFELSVRSFAQESGEKLTQFWLVGQTCSQKDSRLSQPRSERP